jgi:ketosteroid isomerase-like protein
MDTESATRAPDGHDGSGTALPQRNVEQQYRAADAFSRRDLEAFLAICDPDIEVISRHLALDGSGHLRGHAAVRLWWDSLVGVYPNFTSEIEDVRECGDLTVGRQLFRGQSNGSGTQMEQVAWQVTKWRDNKAIWWRSFSTEAEALEAVGLSE